MYKALVFILIFPIACRTFSIESNQCGLKKGGPVVQTVTESSSSFTGLYWDDEHDDLISVSPQEDTTNCYKPKDGSLVRLKVKELDDETLVTVIPIKNAKNQYILVTDKNLYVYTLSGVGDNMSYTLKLYLAVAEEDQTISRAHADTKGRLWLGVHVDNADHGILLRINLVEKKTDVMESKYSYSDFTWCKSNTGLYVVDSRQNVIRSYAYDENTGDISDERIEFDMAVDGKGKLVGRLSAITKDTEGKAWVGFVNSGTVMQYDLDEKTILRTISVPVEYVISLAFGGKDRAQLFVGTRRSSGDPPADLDSGSIFAISGTDATGLKGNPVKLPKDF